MSKPRLAALVGTVVFALSAGAGDAAAPAVHDHGTDGPFPDQQCGIPGTATVRFNNVGTDLGNDTEFNRGSFSYVFTADDTGKSITVHAAGRVVTQAVVDETAGTITFTDTVAGVPELVKVTGGPVLTRDAGLVVGRVRVFELDPVTGEPTGDALTDTWEFLAGPHPDLESGFDRFCQVVEPYLLDP
jgi:hypothetical protein